MHNGFSDCEPCPHPGVARAAPDLPPRGGVGWEAQMGGFTIERHQNQGFHDPSDFLDSPKSPTKVPAKLGTSRS